jgi:hypothetical protein
VLTRPLNVMATTLATPRFDKRRSDLTCLAKTLLACHDAGDAEEERDKTADPCARSQQVQSVSPKMQLAGCSRWRCSMSKPCE